MIVIVVVEDWGLELRLKQLLFFEYGLLGFALHFFPLGSIIADNGGFVPLAGPNWSCLVLLVLLRGFGLI